MTRGHMKTQAIKHKERGSYTSLCRICGAVPGKPCYVMPEPQDDPRDVDTDAQRAWLEFQLMAAVHNLKEFDPNHYLVRAIGAALTPNYEGEDVPSLLKRQAD